jgi:hypothetical protein
MAVCAASLLPSSKLRAEQLPRRPGPGRLWEGPWSRALPQSPEEAPSHRCMAICAVSLSPVLTAQDRTPGSTHPAPASVGGTLVASFAPELATNLLQHGWSSRIPTRTPTAELSDGTNVPLHAFARQQHPHAPRNGSSSDSSRPRPPSTGCGKRLVCRSIIRRTFGGSSPRCRARSRSGM